MINVHITQTHPEARLPRNAYGDDAGWDLFCLQDMMVPVGVPTDLRTGIAVAIPNGYYGRIVHRSSAPRKRGIMVLEGVIDAGFRGELFACAYVWADRVHGIEGVKIKAGDSIAQLIVAPVPRVTFRLCTELPSSVRGERGFGSSDEEMVA